MSVFTRIATRIVPRKSRRATAQLAHDLDTWTPRAWADLPTYHPPRDSRGL